MKVQEHTLINLHRIREGSKRLGVQHPMGPPLPHPTKDSLGPTVRGKAKKTEELGE